MEHDHPLTDEVSVQSPPDAFVAAGAELEKTAAERTRVGHPQVRAELHEWFDEARVVGKDADRSAFDLGEDALVEVLD